MEQKDPEQTGPSSSGQAAASELPSDAAKIQALLQSMGVEDYEPGVVKHLLDFMYKYVTDTLLDAEVRAFLARTLIGPLRGMHEAVWGMSAGGAAPCAH
jgi:hypothetical protein